MKLIIAGSRTIDKYRAYYEAIKFQEQTNTKPMELVTGCAKEGADQVPFLLKDINGIKDSQITKFPVSKEDWKKYGKAAGPRRNRQMAEYGDELLLIWDGESSGSANMKAEMLKLGKPVHEIVLPEFAPKKLRPQPSKEDDI